jgi:RimJ/RimL family protein N-acetyltransferase
MDVPQLVEISTDPRIVDFTSIPGWDTSTAERWVDAQGLAASAGTGLRLAVCAPGNDEALGGVQLKAPDWEERRTEVGYWLRESARGRGLASSAMRELIGYARGELGFERFELYIYPENESSQALARRCGFEREALLHRYVVWEGKRDDMELWALVADDISD